MPPECVNPVNGSLVPVLSAARVLVVAGKGGVGKTTVTAVLASAAAAAGHRVLAVELDGKPVLSRLVGDIPLLELSAPAALEDYLRDHGFGRIAKRLTASGVIDVVSTAAPGIDDIVVLGKIKQLERTGEWDLIVVDGPAAGHAVTMLTSPAGMHDAVRGGPVRSQADDVLELLHDPARCHVVLVTLPETTPVNETIETAFALEDRVGVTLGPVIVNAVDVGPAVHAPGDGDRFGDDWAALVQAAEFRRQRREMQTAAIARLAEALPLPQLHVPLAAASELGPDVVTKLAAAVTPGSVR